MREDVARLERLDDLIEDRIRIDGQAAAFRFRPQLTEVNVDGQSRVASDGRRDLHHVEPPAREAADLGVRLDAFHEVRVRLRRFDSGGGIETIRTVKIRIVVPFQSADDIRRQEREHARRRRFGDEMPEARHRDAAGAALIDERRDARAHAAQVGVQAEAAGHILVDVRVRIDQARQHQPAAAVDDLRVVLARREIRPDRGNPVVLDEDVDDRIEAGCGIDDTAAFQ